MAGAGGASWPGAQTVVEVPRAEENLVGFALFSKRRECVNVISLSQLILCHPSHCKELHPTWTWCTQRKPKLLGIVMPVLPHGFSIKTQRGKKHFGCLQRQGETEETKFLIKLMFNYLSASRSLFSSSPSVLSPGEKHWCQQGFYPHLHSIRDLYMFGCWMNGRQEKRWMRGRDGDSLPLIIGIGLM